MISVIAFRNCSFVSRISLIESSIIIKFASVSPPLGSGPTGGADAVVVCVDAGLGAVAAETAADVAGAIGVMPAAFWNKEMMKEG